MVSRHRLLDYLAAASVVVALGSLFLGRALIYPVGVASGTFLERVAAQSAAWDVGHKWLLVGIIALIPATLGLRRVLRARAPWLVDAATAFSILGAALTVGQFALDFAMMAAAHVEPRAAGEQFLDLLGEQPFVDWAFYKLTDVSQLGLLLFGVALWRQGPSWRPQAAIVSLPIALLLFGDSLGLIGIRVAMGLLFVAFVAVAWKMVAEPARDETGG